MEKCYKARRSSIAVELSFPLKLNDGLAPLARVRC